jgi:hypothetical protein
VQRALGPHHYSLVFQLLGALGVDGDAPSDVSVVPEWHTPADGLLDASVVLDERRLPLALAARGLILTRQPLVATKALWQRSELKREKRKQ